MALRKLRTGNEATTAAPIEVGSEPVPAGVVEATVTETSNAVATRPKQASALAPLPQSSGIVGDWDQSDIKFPTLKIVQGSGELSKQYNTGTLLLGDDELLPPPDLKAPKPEHTFRFVPVLLEKQYRENLSQEEAASGAMPRVVSTLAEVEAAGGTTQWINGEKPSWGPSARVLLLVERPENIPGSGTDHPGFVLELGGKLYAPAVYYCAGTSWTNFAKPLFNAALTTLMIPERDEQGNILKTEKGVIRRTPYLPKSFWAWRTVKRDAGDFTVFAPEIRLGKEETGEELRSFVANLR